MTTVINTNVPAIVAKSNMDRVQRELENSIAKLSSGSRINKAADDAAGMAVANRMESQIRGLTMAIRHGKDGQNLIDTADGAQIEISNMLQRMRELAARGITIIFASTDIQEITYLPDRVITFYRGMMIDEHRLEKIKTPVILKEITDPFNETNL